MKEEEKENLGGDLSYSEFDVKYISTLAAIYFLIMILSIFLFSQN